MIWKMTRKNGSKMVMNGRNRGIVCAFQKVDIGAAGKVQEKAGGQLVPWTSCRQ